MSIQDIMKLKTSKNEEMRAALLLAVHCAPILKGSKVANIVTVTVREFCWMKRLLEKTEIQYRFLKTKDEKGILYLYREKELLNYLDSQEIQTFLRMYRYEKDNVSDMLDRLSERVSLYNNGEIAFPHEIGVFLEYPLHDVKGFLANNGRNFAYSGYWKVYQDVPGAIQKFRRYDRERDYAIHEVMSGMSIHDIVANARL